VVDDETSLVMVSKVTLGYHRILRISSGLFSSQFKMTGHRPAYEEAISYVLLYPAIQVSPRPAHPSTLRTANLLE